MADAEGSTRSGHRHPESARMAWSPRKTAFHLGCRALRVGRRTCWISRPPLIKQLTKGYRAPIVAQRVGDVGAGRLDLTVIDGLAGLPGELSGDRDGDELCISLE